MLTDVGAARSLMDGATQSSITAAFARVSDTKVSYATRQHTKVQVRYVCLLIITRLQ
jgi:hypothetical protein